MLFVKSLFKNLVYLKVICFIAIMFLVQQFTSFITSTKIERSKLNKEVLYFFDNF